jgi:hypothetical protein
MSITLQEAKALKPGNILVDQNKRRWKVTGMVKTWKTDPNRIRVPLKHGLYSYDSLDGYDFDNGVCHTVTMEQS